LCEKSPFNNSNITHGSRNNYQVNFSFIENEGKSLISTEKMKIVEHILVLIKNRLQHSIIHTKMCENTPFHNFNVTHGSRNNYQVNFTFMQNQVNSLNNIEKMVLDEHALVLINNRLQH